MLSLSLSLSSNGRGQGLLFHQLCVYTVVAEQLLAVEDLTGRKLIDTTRFPAVSSAAGLSPHFSVAAAGICSTIHPPTPPGLVREASTVSRNL